ncbi:Nif3-like dinuclear metal center hexameric protein [Escherichia coli]
MEGKETVQKIVTGVTASQALPTRQCVWARTRSLCIVATSGKEDSPVIRGIKRNRLKTLLANDINLYGWHLPLDAILELGNNAQLAALLGITVIGRD